MCFRQQKQDLGRLQVFVAFLAVFDFFQNGRVGIQRLVKVMKTTVNGRF